THPPSRELTKMSDRIGFMRLGVLGNSNATHCFTPLRKLAQPRLPKSSPVHRLTVSDRCAKYPPISLSRRHHHESVAPGLGIDSHTPPASGRFRSGKPASNSR